jgi:hypothetical protein
MKGQVMGFFVIFLLGLTAKISIKSATLAFSNLIFEIWQVKLTIPIQRLYRQ